MGGGADDDDWAAIRAYLQSEFRCAEPLSAALASTEADTRDFYIAYASALSERENNSGGGGGGAVYSLIARNCGGELAGVALNHLDEEAAADATHEENGENGESDSLEPTNIPNFNSERKGAPPLALYETVINYNKFKHNSIVVNYSLVIIVLIIEYN